VQRISKLIKFLGRQNWRFTVLTSSDDIVTLTQDKTMYSEINGLAEVKRIPLTNPADHSKSIFSSIMPRKSGFFQRWISAFFYIPDIRIKWLEPLKQALMEELARQEYDCLLITSPPYSLAMIASQLTMELSIPIILDMRDPWTSNPYKIHPTFYHYRKDLKLELTSITRIRYGVSAYQTLIRYYEKHIQNFNPGAWTVIPNGYDEDDFNGLRKDGFNNNKFNLAFSGTFYSHINKPTPVFKALSRLAPELREKILFHHIGNTQIDLQKMVSKFGLQDHVRLWGYLPHKTCIENLNKMDAFCFILDDKNKYSRNTIGGKVYEYLRLKKPIMALVPADGEAAELINKTKSGVVISPKDIQHICETLKTWVKKPVDYKYSGIEAYSREKQALQFLEVINRACDKKPVIS